jgi:hypothetical protein
VDSEEIYHFFRCVVGVGCRGDCDGDSCGDGVSDGDGGDDGDGGGVGDNFLSGGANGRCCGVSCCLCRW